MGLTLCVYNWNEDDDTFPPNSLTTIEDYLNSPPTWEGDLYEIIVMFDELPMGINDTINNFGVLHNILPQLQEMVDRLTQNKFALLRTAGEHTACFYIVEPHGNKVLFSAYNKLPDDYLSYFPLQDSPMFFMDGRNQRDLLYDFVEKDRIDSQPINSRNAFLEHIKNYEMEFNSLIGSLKKQIEFGNELIKKAK